jgi:phage gpG-like protein
MLSFRFDIPKGMSKEMKKIFIRAASEASNKVANKVTENVKEVFKLEGARGGNEKWEPTTAIARKFRFFDKDAPTLIDSGQLKESIYATVTQDPKVFFITIGTDLDYAYQHNNGMHYYTPPPENDNVAGKTYEVPQRRFLFFTQDDENDAVSVYKRIFDKVMGA